MAVNQLKAGAALSYVVIVANIVIGILYTPFMLRMLGTQEYGIYSLSASIIAYLTILDLGFGNAIVRYTAKFIAQGKQREQWEMFGVFMRLYLLVGVVALAIGLALAFNVESLFGATMSGGEISRLRIMLMLMAFNLAFTFPLSIYGSIITAYENFVFQRIVSLVRIVLNPLVMILLLTMGYKAIGLVIATTAFNLATLLINCYYCYRKLHIKVIFAPFDWSFLREVTIYSMWIFLSAIMDRIYWHSGQFILGIYKGAISVAIYAVAIQLQSLYMMFSTAISGVFLPKVTAMISRGESDEQISDLFIRTGRIQYIIMAFILTGFILFGRSFVVLWAGAEYVEAYTIALIFFIPLTVPLIQNLGITILQARNQLKFRSLLYLSIAIVSLIFSIILAPRYGGIGCAAATAGALFVGQIVVMNIYYRRRVGLNIARFWGEIAKMSAVPLLFLVVGHYLTKHFSLDTIPSLLAAMAIFALLYIPAFWALALNSYERELLTRPIVKLLKIGAR